MEQVRTSDYGTDTASAARFQTRHLALAASDCSVLSPVNHELEFKPQPGSASVNQYFPLLINRMGDKRRECFIIGNCTDFKSKWLTSGGFFSNYDSSECGGHVLEQNDNFTESDWSKKST